MKVEAAGDAVDVEDLAGKVKAGDHSTLHRLEVHVAEMHPAAGDKLVLVHALAIDLETASTELLGQTPSQRFWQMRPSQLSHIPLRLHKSPFNQSLPEPIRQSELAVVDDALARRAHPQFLKLL